jgi:AraC-like DNA-binding protein
VQLEGALYIHAEFTAPWCIRGRHGRASIRERLAGAEHIVFFHFLTEGGCSIRLVDESQVLDVRAGDLVLFPQDDRHLMGSDLLITPLDTDNLERPTAADEARLIEIRHGGGGMTTRFVCGYLACSRSQFRMLLGALPRVLHIPFGDGQVASLMRELFQVGVHLSSAIRPGVVTPSPGAGSTLAKVADLLFVEAIRRYAEMLPPGGPGWLAAARDAHIGRALAMLHEAPGRPWTVDELAREVALSRSALAERFTALVGEPPIQYLTRWRLALAARTLRSGQQAIGQIAEGIGYESEAAFSRAFKREFGVPPVEWRKSASL